MTEQVPGELIYEYTIQSTGATSYGVPALDALLSSVADIPPQGARYDLAFQGPIVGQRLRGTVELTDYIHIRARGSDAAHGNRGPPVDRGLPRASLVLTPLRPGRTGTPRRRRSGRRRLRVDEPGHLGPRGVNAIKLNSRGQIVQLTSIWDGSLVTPAWITQHLSLTIES
jgi:hypothetical protein